MSPRRRRIVAALAGAVLGVVVAVALSGCNPLPAGPPSTETTLAVLRPTTPTAATTGTSGRPPATTTTPTVCDATLWQHVYHPARLKIIRPCLTVTGTITHIAREADGDTHIRLAPDPADRWTLQPANVTGQHGDLVLEPVCERPPTQADAKPACAGYRSPVVVPPVGAHVQVSGSYVYDLGHGRWAEIHPVTSIEARP